MPDSGPDLSRRRFLAASGALGIGLLMTGGVAACAAPAEGAAGPDPVDWAGFLAGLDLRWTRVPRTFYEGPFLGNGGLGAAFYQVGDRLAFTLGDSRVRDHQGLDSSTFGDARLRIGRLELVTTGEVTDVDLRFALYDAELRGTVTTTAGQVTLTAFVDSVRDVLVVSASGAGGEKVDWSFVPYPARSSRFDFRTDDLPAGLRENPAPEPAADRCVQRLAAGGGTTTMWRRTGDTLVLTVAHSHPQDTSTADARRTLDGAPDIGALTDEHRSWWHAYYPRSFVSVPDGRIQAFYWTQLYKIAAATRQDRPPVGTAAIWLEPTPWPATWWNLNVQLEYWLLNATAHYELDSLTAALDRHRDNLARNVPERYRASCYGMARTSQEDLRTLVLAEAGDPTASGPRLELGNLTYALHNVWLRYRHTMDDDLLRRVLFPILRGAVNYMLQFVTEGQDGRLHMPRTYSPEYDFADDCNYTLSLLAWGCRTLTWSADRLGVADPLAQRWREVVDRMVTPPQGPDGLWIGAAVPLEKSHRHYSHLQWFYPLYLLDVTDPGHRDLLERSLAHWVGFEGALQGYTFTGASSMSALLGKGDDALRYLDELLDRFVQPNTMYAETGPVVETPLSGAQSVHDMLLTSWGDRIRIMPGVPSGWRDVSFRRLRAEGAFEVSAARRAGRVEWVRVRSLAGEPCRVQPGDLPTPWSVVGGGGFRVEGDVIVVELEQGQEALVVTEGTDPDTTAEPDAASYAWGTAAVARGRSVAVALADAFTDDGVSHEENQRDGDLGNGYTLPAEELPTAGPLRLDGVDWVFPDTRDGARNTVVPAGQRLAVGRGRYARLHLLGTAVPTGGAGAEFDASAPAVVPVTVEYADGGRTVLEVSLSLWDQRAAHGDGVAFQVSHRHSADRPVGPPIAQSARVYHQHVDLDPSRELTALVLGPNRNAAGNRAHLLAMSLEEPG